MRQRIIFTLVVALLASSCQKKAEGQTVAVVNDEEITAAELNNALTSDNSLSALNPKDARAAELQKLIDRKLVVQQARSDGLDTSPEFVSQQRRLTEDLLINMLVSKRLSTSQLPSTAEINGFQASHPGIFANREIWTLDQVIYPLSKNAALNAKLSSAKSIDEVAQALTAAGAQFTRGTKKIDSGVFPQRLYAQIAALAAGEPFIAPGPDKAVASAIVAREPAPITGDQARTVALEGIRKEQANKFVQERVKDLRAKAKIEYQPGFGPPAKK